MWIICASDDLRTDIVSSLSKNDKKPAEKEIFNVFPVLPSQGNVVVGIEDLNDANLRLAVRHFIVNAYGSTRLAIVRREWPDVLVERLDEIVRTEYQCADQLTQAAFQKLSNVPSGTWKTEREQQLSEWKTFPPITYTPFVLNNELASKLEDYFPHMHKFNLQEEDHHISAKPPVLHWTPSPLDGDLQVIFRITFPVAGPDDSVFREICSNLRKRSEHPYEWLHGVFLNNDPIRIHVERMSECVIEIASRICVDELEDNQSDKPMLLVWPHLAAALREVLAVVDQHQNLTYNVDIVLFEPFFQPAIESRVFDLTLFMSTAHKHNKVGCKVGDQSYEVKMNLLFPEGPFASLKDLFALESVVEHVSPPESVHELNTDELPHIEQTGGLQVHHNRGRRVSFGTIKMMNEAAIPVANGVDDYVDNLLKQSIDMKSLYVD